MMTTTQAYEENILITGSGGFIGQLLAAALIESSPTIRLTLTDIIEPPIPKTGTQKNDRITTVKSDLTSQEAVDELLTSPFTAVYLLHGLMSGGAEANLELGWRVN